MSEGDDAFILSSVNEARIASCAIAGRCGQEMYIVREGTVLSAGSDKMRPEFPASCHPDTIAMYEYWREKRGARSMPARSDIDPIDMPPRLLPFINLVDVVP